MALPTQILVPTDFSEPSAKAVEHAFELASALGAKVSLLHAYGIPSLPDGALVGTVIDELSKAAELEFAKETAKWKASPWMGDAYLRMGDPRDVIVHAARQLKADLIVMASHGRRGLQRILLGSVAESVVRTAPCDVLVMHQGQASGEGEAR